MASLPSLSELKAKLLRWGISLPAGDIRVGAYGDSAQLSHDLLQLIRHGNKRAGTSLLWELEHDREAIGRAGMIEIVVDHRGEPSVITRDISVAVLPFSEVCAEYAATEAEGDGSLGYWRAGHWAYFSRVCARIGRTPAESMPVVCSVFEVLHVLPESLIGGQACLVLET